MKTSFTVRKNSAFFKTLSTQVLLLLVLLTPGMEGKVFGQEKVYADLGVSSGVEVLNPLLGTGNAAVNNAGNAADHSDNAVAELVSTRVLAGILGSGDAWLQLKFPEQTGTDGPDIPAKSATFFKIDAPTLTGISLDLGGLLTLANNVIPAELYSGSTSGSNGTRINNITVNSKIIKGGDGSYYLMVNSPDNTTDYDAVRIRLTFSGLNVTVASNLRLNVYDAFALSTDASCGVALFTDIGETTGITVALNDVVRNPERAVDVDTTTTFSSIQPGNLTVAGSVFQTFYFNGLSQPQDYFKIKLRIGGGVALNLNLLGNYEVRAYNGSVLVYTKKLQGGLINGVDLLGLLQSGNPVTIPFGPGVSFDRISIGINTTAGVNLAGSPLEIYNVARYPGVGSTVLTCTDPDPIAPPTPSAPMLNQKDCATNVLSFDHADFPYNAVDGNNDTYTTLEASSGLAAGIAGYAGHVELGFGNIVAAGDTVYVRIDFDEEQLGSLLNGTVGQLLGSTLDNVLFGKHYFTVEAKNGNTAVLTRSSNNGFNASGGVGTGTVRVVQDKNGHYYIALTSNTAFSSIRITENLSSIVGLGTIKNMHVYHACFSTGVDLCEQAFSTYSESEGLTLDLLGVGNSGVTNAQNAIDEDTSSFSEINLGAVNVAGSIAQVINYQALSSAEDFFKVKLAINAGQALDLNLLGAFEVQALNGDEVVYSNTLSGGLVAGLDVLGAISNDQVVTLTFGPGRPFNKIVIRSRSGLSVSAFSSSVKVYDVKRYGPACPDPDATAVEPSESPFTTPACDASIVDFDHVDFAANATDGNNETYATLHANSGNLLTDQAYSGFIELALPEERVANTTSYIRIDFEDQDLIDQLLGGTVGNLVSDVTGILLGSHYFEVEAKSGSGTRVLLGSSEHTFHDTEGGALRIVQDKIGRYYIAVTPNAAYKNIRITEHFPALLGGLTQTGQKSMKVFDLCYETAADTCLPAVMTSFDGSALATVSTTDNTAGVKNPERAINNNSSDYSEISLGTASVLGAVEQFVYYATPGVAGDQVKVRLQTSAPSILNADVIGQYLVRTYNGETLQETFTLQQGLINGLDVLGLFKSGGIATLTFNTTLPFDRISVGMGSAVNVSTAPPIRLYELKRITASCPPDPATQSPFENPTCADNLISASNADDVENLFDADFDSYATLNSGAGFLLGANQYEGSVEIGFDGNVDPDKTTYIRIDYDDDMLSSLLGGSIGGALADIVNGLVLGNHFFDVEVKNGANVVLQGSSNNGFSGSTDRIRIVQDKLGRYYLAVTPNAAYKSIKITDHTNSALGLLAEPNTMHVYGACFDDPTSACSPAFATSYDAAGLTLDAAGLAGSGVADAYHVIDDNSTNYSQISLGAVAAGASVKQYIYFNKPGDANDQVDIELDFATNTGINIDLLGNIEIVAYNGPTPVDTLVWESNGIINGVNVLGALSNGQHGVVPYAPGKTFDRVSIGLKSVLAINVGLPVLRIYKAEKVCDVVPQSVAWKSFAINADPAIKTVKGGEEVAYTVHVRNTGTVDIQGLLVTDTIPAHTSLVSGSISDGGQLADNIITWSDVDVAQGVNAIRTFRVKVDSNLSNVTNIHNVALVKKDASDPGTETFPPSATDPDEPDDSGSTGTDIPVDATDSVVAWKGYAIANGASTTQVSGGEEITYTIYVKNTSNRDLAGLIVTDAIPAGTTFKSTANGSSDGTTVTFNPIDVAFGATVPLSFVVTVKTDLSAVTEISNVAFVKMDAADPGTTGTVPPADPANPANGPDEAATPGTPTVIPVDPISSLLSWKSYTVNGSPDSTAVRGGEEIEYTIFARNTGNQALSNVQISDVLPDGVTYVSGGSQTGNIVTFTVPALGVGATSSGYSFKVKVDSNLTNIDRIRNVATVVSNEITTPVESFPPVDNTTATEPDTTGDTGTVLDVTPVHDVDLALTGISDGDNTGQAAEGDVITYTITVTNTGNKTLTNVPVEGLVPEHTTYVTGSGGTENAGTVSFTAASLAPGAKQTFTYQVTVGAIDNNIPSIVNTATVTYRNAANTADVSKTATHTMPTSCTAVEAANIGLTADQAICEGATVTLTATISGVTDVDPAFIKWYNNANLNGTPLTGASIEVSPATTTTYYVLVEGEGFCFNNPPATTTVTITPAPETPTIDVANAVLCQGETTTLTASVTAAHYRWFNGTSEITGQTDQTITVGEAGIYTAIAVTEGGCESGISAGVTVVVNPKPATPLITADGSTTICEGSGLLLNSDAVEGNQWYLNGDPLPGETGQTLNATIAGNYTVIVSNSTCSSDPSNTLAIAVNPVPEITISGETSYSIEVGNSVPLPDVSVTPAGATYRWTDDQGQSVPANAAATRVFDTPGTYTYTVTASNGDCEATTSITILVYDASACPVGYERDYVSSGSAASGVSGLSKAYGPNLTDFALINVPLIGLFGGHNDFNLAFTDSYQDGADLHVKLGTQIAANLLGSVNMKLQPLNNGAPVGTPLTLSGGVLLNLLAGDNISDVLVPTAGLAFNGVRITVGGGLVSLAQIKVYAAYVNKKVSSFANCEEVSDILTGATSGLLGGVNNVANPENVVDADTSTYAELRQNVNALGYVHLTTVYPSVAAAGDSVRVLLKNSGSGLLDLNVLTGVNIVAYNGNNEVARVDVSGSGLINLRLLAPGSDFNELSFAVNAPFDRVSVQAGGVASALTSLEVYRIERVAKINVTVPVANDGIFEVCQGGVISLADDNCGTTYEWFAAPSGGTALGSGPDFTVPANWPVGRDTLYVQPRRFNCDFGGRIPVIIEIKKAPNAGDITVTPSAASYCPEEQVVLTASVAGMTDPQFSWFTDAQKEHPVADGNGVTYTIANNKLTIAGLAPGTHAYFVSVKDGADGCENAPGDLATANVIINNQATDADIDVDNVALCARGDVVFAPATTIVNPVFTWYYDAAKTNPIVTGVDPDIAGVHYALSANGELTITGLPFGTDRNYFVTVEGDGYCVNATAKEVNVQINTTLSNPQLQPVTVCAGEDAVLTIDNFAEGTRYNFYTTIGGTTAAFTTDFNTLSIPAAQVVDGAAYWVEAVNIAGGCTSESRTEVIIHVNPRAAAADVNVATHPSDICEGETVVFTASSTTVANPVFRWYTTADLSDTPFEGAEYSPASLAVGTNTFYVTVSGDGVCESAAADAKAVTINVNQKPDAPQVVTAVSVSKGQSVQLTAELGAPQSGNADYEIVWLDGTTETVGTTFTIPANLPVGDKTYEVFVRSKTGASCESDHITVTVTVTEVIDGDCLVANAQRSGIDGGLCLLCGVSEGGNAVDANAGNYATFHRTVNLAATLWQELIFPNGGKAGDTVTVVIGGNGSLLDVSLLGDLKIQTYNNATANNDGLGSSTGLINIQLLPNSTDANAVRFIAGADFDRVRISQRDLLAALANDLRVYGANISLPRPTDILPVDGTEYCQGETITLSATAPVGTQLRWFDDEGKALGDGASVTTTAPTDKLGVLIYEVVAFRTNTSGEACFGERIPVRITINGTVPPALTELSQTFCEIDSATVADLDTTGAIGTVTWYSRPEGGTPLAATTALAAGKYYAAQTGADCESATRTEVTVTITATLPPALTELSQTFCEIDSATVADLSTAGATGTVTWYSTPDGGTPLAATTALAAGKYYAAQTGADCESATRTEVTVTITATPAPALTELSQNFCEIDSATVADLSTAGATGAVTWYSTPDGGTPLAATTALSAGKYYAAQTGADCESATRTEVTVTITATPAPALTELSQTFCEIDSATVADLSTAGATGTVTWYSTPDGGTPLAATTALAAGKYYAAQTGADCESATRTEVTVTITATPAPALTELSQTFCEIDSATVADLSIAGATGKVTWYSTPDGGTPLAATTALAAGKYYAAQTGADCESATRTEVTVTITATPPPAIDDAAPVFCESDNATLADLQVVGTGIKWYASATSTDALPSSTILKNGVTYYASQMGTDCESANRLAVKPVVNDCSSLLSITKVADQARVKAGESTTFTLTITNTGPGVIHSGDVIKLTERPGAGVTITDYDVISGNGTVDATDNKATVTTNTEIPVNGTIIVKVTAAVAANAGATITNGITVWGPDKDPGTDPEDDHDDTPDIPVDHASTLSITKVADQPRVKAGTNTTFTLTIKNNGPADIAVGKVINLTERPGTGVTITKYEVTSANGTITGTGNTAKVTTNKVVANGGTIVVKVTAAIAANAGETITNGITVWGPDKDPGTDPEDDHDDTPDIPVDHDAVLSITKVADEARVKAGESTTFTLTITNNGPADIVSGKLINLTERPGAGVTITKYEVTSGNGTVAGTGNTAIVTTNKVIAVRETIIVKVTADIAADAPAAINNGITVWGPDKNPARDPEDDKDDMDPVPVDFISKLSITKVADEDQVKAGQSTTFTVTVTNEGPVDIAAGKLIELEERPGAGVTITKYEVISGPATINGTADKATLTTTAAFENGATIVVRVTADVDVNRTGTISNGIAVWGPDRPTTGDPDDEDTTPDIPVIPVDRTVKVPNVFTPNGDGLNDLFVIKGLEYYPDNSLMIVNRWGNTVYKATNYQNNWTGDNLSEGTYYYIFRYKDQSGVWRTEKGAVALVRVTNR